MKVTSVEKKEKSTVELTIQVEAAEFEAAVQKAYLKQRGSINVPGFRKGKAPRKVIEGMYGTGVFYEEAINEAYPQAYEQALKEQELDAVGYPETEIVEAGKDGFVFKALVPVRPEVKLGEYKGLTATKETPKVTEEDIDNEMKPYIERATRLASVEREAQMGDTTNIDFEGFDNGTAFEGGKGENYELKLGSGSFVPGFEEQIVGMKAGEEKDIDITFPEDYHKELAGKAVVFHVKVNEVKESIAPVVDDEFAKDVSEFETLEAFRADLAQKLTELREKGAEADFNNQIMEQVIANMECDIPEAMINEEVDRAIDEQAQQFRNYGMDPNEYYKMVGENIEMIRAELRPGALQRVQARLAMSAVADAENIEISAEDLDAEYDAIAEQYKIEIERVKALINPEDLENDLRMRKANELVLAAAKAKKKTTRKKKTEEAEEPKAE